jgi:nitric oxide reductase subunit B
MDVFKKNKPLNPTLFVAFGLILLALGLTFGLIGALQYILPGAFMEYFSFEKIRPLHVTSVVFWIILAATGSVLTYLQMYSGKAMPSNGVLKLQFVLNLISMPLILGSYFLGHFGGREYWEFNPLFALPILAGWLCFIYHFFKTLPSFKNQPVYVWMWFTGILFFLFTFIESYLWLIPYFRTNIVNDMTIQWKSYGSMVGSWNMLIYGSSLFLMEKISGNKTYAVSKIAFALYFIGLTNLMFNWGHHIYTLPTHNYIKHISYLISMTELLIIGRIIYKWKSTLSDAKKYHHFLSYRFIIAADVWIFLTLILAVLMSIPAINIFTHGTHITVAHTMGATIGINSFLLLAFATDIFQVPNHNNPRFLKRFNQVYWLVNAALLVFWVSLILAGIYKSSWQMSEEKIPFSTMMKNLKPFFITFFTSGFTLAIGLYWLIFNILKSKLTQK